MNNHPDWLRTSLFNWETLQVVCSGKSSIDARNYLTEIWGEDQVYDFLNGYGFDLHNPIESAELFGIYQEALQFIKRYFLIEGSPDGLPLQIPAEFFTFTNISQVFLIATGGNQKAAQSETALWAGVILKVMHTILHADKDLRYRYYLVIQQQIFDRFYKFIHRDKNNQLWLKNDKEAAVPLVDFETKAKKTRDSVIIKLLHKQETTAEELFDRIGLRFITHSRLDSLRVIKFLVQNYVIMINNIKPSRSQNTLVDLDLLKQRMPHLLKKQIREGWDQVRYDQELLNLVEDCQFRDKVHEKNDHSSRQYKAIHFTGRQLIKYRNPFMSQFSEVRKLALQDRDNPLSQKLLSLDTSPISRDVRFFYPFEVQITDQESHRENTRGEASHQEYKRAQVRSAMKRIFKPLLKSDK
jgi:uncharacterized protein (TIGR04562 family)